MARNVLIIALILLVLAPTSNRAQQQGSTGLPATVVRTNKSSVYTVGPQDFTAIVHTVATQAASDNSTKAASTAFVTTAISNAIAGVNPAVAVQAATTVAGDTSALMYNNGVSGIGATFTGSNNTALTVDGFTFTTVGQRLLVKNDTQAPSGAFNGIYNVTQIQTAILPPILTRALDYDQPSDINNTGAIPVINGTLNAQTTWVETATVNTVGTDPLSFIQFSINPTKTTQTICNGTVALGTTAIASGAKSTVATSTCTGLLTTDNIMMDFNSDPSAVTGYAPSANGTLTLIKFPTANTINVYQYNDTAASITPGAVTVNYRVVR